MCTLSNHVLGMEMVVSVFVIEPCAGRGGTS
jgi:hypothetical protein